MNGIWFCDSNALLTFANLNILFEYENVFCDKV